MKRNDWIQSKLYTSMKISSSTINTLFIPILRSLSKNRQNLWILNLSTVLMFQTNFFLYILLHKSQYSHLLKWSWSIVFQAFLRSFKMSLWVSLLFPLYCSVLSLDHCILWSLGLKNEESGCVEGRKKIKSKCIYSKMYSIW